MTSDDALPAHLEQIGRQLTAAAHELYAAQRNAGRSGFLDAFRFSRSAAPARRPLAHRAGALAVLVVAAAAITAVIVNHRTGESAWARQAIRRAAAVVTPPTSSNVILHIAATETLSALAQRATHTTFSTLTEQDWIQQGPPWGERAIMQVPGGPVLERGSSGEIYNQTTNTVYPALVIPSGTPKYTLTATGNGNFRLSAPLPDGSIATSPGKIDAQTAQALKDGSEQVQWAVTWDGQTQQTVPVVMPSAGQLAQSQAQQPDAASTDFAAQLHALLDSGSAQVTQTTTADGQPAIEIASEHPQSGPPVDYYVNPQTYAPIELDIFGYDNPKDVIRVRFTTYETLPLAGNQQLLQLAVPASAQTDNTPADYWSANLPRFF